jgi:hypothetical protein
MVSITDNYLPTKVPETIEEDIYIYELLNIGNKIGSG